VADALNVPEVFISIGGAGRGEGGDVSQDLLMKAAIVSYQFIL